jgi:hypothetical protein
LCMYYKNKLDEQNGLLKAWSCSRGYFTLKILVEKHREFNIQMHIAFVDFKKASDKSQRDKINRNSSPWWSPTDNKKSTLYIYKNVKQKSNFSKNWEQTAINRGTG